MVYEIGVDMVVLYTQGTYKYIQYDIYLQIL